MAKVATTIVAVCLFLCFFTTASAFTIASPNHHLVSSSRVARREATTVLQLSDEPNAVNEEEEEESVEPPKPAVKCPDCDMCDGSGR
eukprot:12395598-Ditylum_brightwellii.AAC.1